MLDALFTFSGRIDRGTFLRWSAFQAALSALLLAGIEGFSIETLTALHAGSSIGAQAPNIGIVLVLGLALVVLPASALLVKRLRDVGLPAWPSFAVISLVDALFSAVVPHSTGYIEGPFAGLAFNMVVTILLVFVPGRTDTTKAEATADWVARSADAEHKLIEERRLEMGKAQNFALLDQLAALQSVRQQGEAIERRRTIPNDQDRQTFGRRVGDRG